MSDSPTQPPLPPAPAKMALLRMLDFPDRISPMLVKELRQGLRARAFVIAFLALHFLLVLVTLITFGNPVKTGPSGMFWFIVVTIVAGVLPLRGFNALSEEIKLNTLDTLVMTKLSAVRIVFGKWSAVASQILLIGITVGPYILARYFAGGVDLFRELVFLMLLVVGGWVLAAWCVGLSWIKYFLLRGTLCLGAAVLFWRVALFSADAFLIHSRDQALAELAPGTFALGSLGLMYAGVFLVAYLLELGAAKIAPVSENRSTTRRLFGLVSAALLLAGCAWGPDGAAQPATWGFMGILLLAAIDSANEEPKHLTPIYEPFVRRGWLGRIAGRILYPGWHAGVLYFLVLATCLLGWLYFDYLSRGADAGLKLLSAQETVGLLVIAMLVVRFWHLRRAANTMGAFVAVLLIFSAMQSFIRLLAEAASPPSTTNFLPFLPGSGQLSTDAASRVTMAALPAGELDKALQISWLLLAAYSGVLCLLSGVEFRETRRLENQIKTGSLPEPADP